MLKYAHDPKGDANTTCSKSCPWHEDDDDLFDHMIKNGNFECLLYAYYNNHPHREKMYERLKEKLIEENLSWFSEYVQNQIIVRKTLKSWIRRFLEKYYSPDSPGFLSRKEHFLSLREKY